MKTISVNKAKNKHMKTKTWVWYWSDGGYNSCQAITRVDAMIIANRMGNNYGWQVVNLHEAKPGDFLCELAYQAKSESK